MPKIAHFIAVLLLGLMNPWDVSQAQSATDPFVGKEFIGRIAYSADGNHNDPDDWIASPVALAIFAEASLKERLVHFDHHCILPETNAEWERIHRSDEISVSAQSDGKTACRLDYVQFNRPDDKVSSAAMLNKAPYPPSPVIERVEFDWTTHRREAPGSDNWPITWADDGHQYTAWGDGGGFGGDNNQARVTLGVARIEGDVAGYTGKNIWGGFQTVNPATFAGKSYGVLSVNKNLFMWVVPQPGPHLRECQIARSMDHGASWQQADWSFRFEEGVSIPTFLNFGRDYAGARDGFVYSYFIEPQWGPATPKGSRFGFEVHKPGRIHLSRAPQDRLLQRSSHEFFAGLDTADEPTWSSNINDKQPVFTDAGGVGWNVSASYNAGLGRYMLATEHGDTHVGKFGLFDASEPWGPWTTIAYDESFGNGHVEVSAFFWSLPTKWLSDDGTHFTMVFTGKNSNDSWNTVSGKFIRR